MIKEIEIKVPTDWTGISLKKYLELQTDLETYKDDDAAVTAIMLYHLCGLDLKYLNAIPVETYSEIRDTLALFTNGIEIPLKRVINIDGIEYGFEPNLSKMAYGAYVDISKYQTMAIDKNWANIMSILYRPVKHKKGEMYSIDTYTGIDNSAKFINVGMDIHFGALFFLLNLSMDLLNSTLNSSMAMELPPNIKSTLARSGGLIQQLLNWQKGIFSK
jgi:uncharacterized protein (UPF0248 family)